MIAWTAQQLNIPVCPESEQTRLEIPTVNLSPLFTYRRATTASSPIRPAP